VRQKATRQKRSGLTEIGGASDAGFGTQNAVGPPGREGAGRVSQLREMPDARGEDGEARLPA